MTQITHVVDILFSSQPFDQAKKKKEPFYFNPILTATYGSITFYIKKAEVVRGDILFYAPNDNHRFLSNIENPRMKEAIVLAIHQALLNQPTKPQNYESNTY